MLAPRRTVPRDSDELVFLSNAAVALGEIGPDQDIFLFVTEQLALLVPDTVVVTTSYDPSNSTTVVRALVGPEDMLASAREVAGEGLGQVFRVDEQARQILAEGKLVRLDEGMHQLTFRSWSAEVARRFEARLGIRSVYGQPFSRKGDFLGAVALLSRAPSLEHARSIEAFVRLAAVAILRQRAEAQLRDSERRFRMLAENSQDVIFRLRLEPKLAFEYVSPATMRLCGRTPEEIYADARLGAPCLYPEEWTSTEPLRELPREPVVARACHAAGGYVWTEQNFTPIRDASGRIVAVEGTVRNISKRKAAEAALIEADRRKTEFLAVLSHELRNPLGSIRNGVHVLGLAEPGGEQATRACEVIERQVAHLARIIDDLLDVTRITRGKIRLQRKRIELNELVKAAVHDLRATFAGAGVDIEVLTGPADVFVSADPTRICQVVDNLLQNAAKFTPRGGRTEVSVRADTAPDQAVLRVHNTGAPIPAEVLAHLFEPFIQADRTLDRSKGGLGLGLALVKGLVEMHAGSVEVESDRRIEGTTFTIRLPLDKTIPEAVRADTASETPGPAHRRVLVIEDNADAAAMLRDALELHENTVAVASAGPEGIATARVFEPDVVLCDIGLPAMDGYAVARAIRADPQLGKLALVALSGYASPEDVAKSRDAGFDRHVAKPLSMDVLERIMTELVGRPSPPAGSRRSSLMPPSQPRGSPRAHR